MKTSGAYAYDAITESPTKADRIRLRHALEPGLSVQGLAERFGVTDTAVRYALGLKKAGRKRK